MKLIFFYVLAAALVVFFIIGLVGFIGFVKKAFEDD